MNRSTLVSSVVAAIVGVGALMASVVGDGMNGKNKNDAGASASSRAATVVMAADYSGTPVSTYASEASPLVMAEDSRLNNYRLERDSCCIGN